MSSFNGCLALGQCQTMTSGLRVFILPVPAAAFLDLDGMAGVLAMEDRGIEAVENPSLLFVQGSQVSHFLTKRAHIIPSLSVVYNIHIEALPVCLTFPGYNNSHWALASLTYFVPSFLYNFPVLLSGHLSSFPLPKSFFFFFILSLPSRSSSSHSSMEASWNFCWIYSLLGALLLS